MRHRRACLVLAAILLAGCAHELLPVSESPVVKRAVGGSAAPAPSSRDASAAIPEFHVVQRGDTLFSIAWRHGLDYRDVARLNGIAEPWVIQVDQKIRLRASSRHSAGDARTNTRAPAESTKPAKKPPAREAAGRPPAIAEQAAGSPSSTGTPPSVPSRASTEPAAPVSSPLQQTPAPTAGSWRWPAEGQLTGKFASAGSGPRGIGIAGNAGDPVRAARDGQVVYTGSGLVGYGELVIVRHDEAYLSAYAHNRRLLVGEGDRVKAGQAIAEMGSTASDRVKLHFEIRRNGQPVDPLTLLPPRR